MKLENIKNWEFTKPKDKSLWRLNIYLNKSQSHKASCERFLEFLERQEKYLVNLVKEGIQGNHFLRNILTIRDKITDLQNAKKKYVEVGI